MNHGARHDSPRPRRGFTLMEVLAALLILGIVLPFAMSGIGTAMEAGAASKRRTEAATLAEMKLNEVALLAGAGLYNNGSETADFGAQWPGYKYTVETATNDFGAQLELIEVLVTVTWAEQGRERSVRMSTLVADPTTTASTGARRGSMVGLNGAAARGGV